VPVTADSLAEELARLEAAIRPHQGRAQEPAPPHHPHHHGGEGHARHHFASMQVKLEGPVDEQEFLAFLRELPPEILRAKGIVELRHPPGERRSFQKVDVHTEISPCRLADPEAVAPVAVFVGPSIPEAVVRARLARLIGL
jgi:G3E family GTPase